MLRQYLDALDYIHSRGIAHRDLKLENTLIGQNGIIRISGFECAISLATLADPAIPKRKEGTIVYMAPEVLQQLPVQDGRKTDVFSLGVALFVIYFQTHPFETYAHEHDRYYRLIHDGFLDQFWAEQVARLNINQELPVDFVVLISRMMQPNPELRPSIAQIREHPWLVN